MISNNIKRSKFINCKPRSKGRYDFFNLLFKKSKQPLESQAGALSPIRASSSAVSASGLRISANFRAKLPQDFLLRVAAEEDQADESARAHDSPSLLAII
ncbi:Hypothetical protein NTJ_13310 [Nesidiocoris tenuis]|uniref:Uncharacterized protein n=1 Tax=Nesidiocoris tenuis TaxID=355587 RepID=A0ABN7B8C8_9HEMI|nr:Hypothetical protein NTJ_13310 [Nesidiocoris tenuis]